MERVQFNGWDNSVRLSNGEMDLVVTTAVGPRIARVGFRGQQNLMAEIAGQQGGSGESEWMIRGGHRLWLAPEVEPDTYELDNAAIEVEELDGGIRTLQPPGPITGVCKSMEIRLAPDRNAVSVVHVLENCGAEGRRLAPWALTVLAAGGMAIIPLPVKIPHTDRLTHNQEWSIWGYTDMTDPRWTWGSRFVLFRQDVSRGPAKLGMAHREGWAAYQLGTDVLVKQFEYLAGAAYPDGGVNLETFSNEEFLELETLGPSVTLAPGERATHEERWLLFRGVPPCDTEEEVQERIVPLLSERAS